MPTTIGADPGGEPCLLRIPGADIDAPVPLFSPLVPQGEGFPSRAGGEGSVAGERARLAGIGRRSGGQTRPVSTEAEAPTPARFVRDGTTWLAYLGLAYFAYLQSVLGPLMPFLRAELALDYTTAGFHFSAFALGSVAVGLLANPIGRRWGRRVAFWAGAAGMAPGALLLVASPSPAGTVAGAALMGVLGVTLLATDQAILADGHRRWRGVALAESNVAASLATILASRRGRRSSPGPAWGWRAAVVAPLLVLGLLALRFRRTPIPRSGRRSRRVGRPEGEGCRPPSGPTGRSCSSGSRPSGRSASGAASSWSRGSACGGRTRRRRSGLLRRDGRRPDPRQPVGPARPGRSAPAGVARRRARRIPAVLAGAGRPS
jgi:hypothetical protein